MEKKVAREAADGPQGGNAAGEQVQATLEGVVSMEPDTAEEVVWAAARSEGYNEVVDMPDESFRGDPPYLADSVLGRETQQGAGNDQVVEIPAVEGDGLLENSKSRDRNGVESREDEPEIEEE